MPAWVVPAIGSAVSLALNSRKRKGTYGKVRSIGERYRAEKPVGFVTPEDTEYFRGRGEFQRERGSRAIGALGQQQRGATTARLVARGLGYSPAAEYLAREADIDEADQLTGLNRDIGEFQEKGLYDVRSKREAFDQQRLMTAWGAELGAVQRDRKST